MKQNMGNADRGIRIILAILFAFLYFTGTVTGAFGLVILILGSVFLLTSLVSFCPLYSLIGISTCSVKKTAHHQPPSQNRHHQKQVHH